MLHLADSSRGGFVGCVRSEYEELLARIARCCFEPDVFRSEQTKQLIAYARAVYGDELEFLWQRSPKNAVWRRRDSSKWYAVLLTVPRSRFIADSDEPVEVIDLRVDLNKLDQLMERDGYYPGYHMNKKSWYTIILDGTVALDELCQRLAESYRLAAK